MTGKPRKYRLAGLRRRGVGERELRQLLDRWPGSSGAAEAAYRLAGDPPGKMRRTRRFVQKRCHQFEFLVVHLHFRGPVMKLEIAVSVTDNATSARAAKT